MAEPSLPALGKVYLQEKEPVIAGSHGTWTLVYTVGSLGIDSGGQLKIARRLVSDWGEPQFSDKSGEGYSSAVTSGAARLHASWQPRGYVRPKTPSVVIDIYDGSLSPGDTIVITLGDKAFGAPGLRAQTYVESRFEFLVLVDPTNSTDPRPVDRSPTVSVVAGPMQALVCLLPSQLTVDAPAEIFVKGEDRWRNATPAPDDVYFEWVGTGEVEIEANAITARSPGCGYLSARAGEFSCRSNPAALEAASSPLRRYWGDLHAQTGETVGVGSEDEYFTFGRKWGYLDFISHQGNDFQMDDEYWQHVNATTRKFYQEGQYVVFPGYEWSASSPTGGDHNVFYRREGYPILRSSHWLVPHVPADELTPAHPAPIFYARLKEEVPLADALVCMHVGGRYANLREFFDPELISLVELVSCWGVFEWMLWDAFERDYIVGIMCNSDGHHGRPGAEGAGMAEFGIENGLTCVLAGSLMRDAIFDALKARNCYGTTGARMLLDFRANDQPMGSILTQWSAPLSIEARVTGAAALESLQLYRGKEVIHAVRPAAFERLSNSKQIRISWQGSRERGRQRRVTWDGAVQVEGCSIEEVTLFSFDVTADGVVSQSDKEVQFRSRTTGDRDGLDLRLNDASLGRLIFDSAAGEFALDLAELSAVSPRRTYNFGGVDMQVIVERYPGVVDTLALELTQTVNPPAGKLTPYFVKATQVDGQMAWASPIYVDNR